MTTAPAEMERCRSREMYQEALRGPKRLEVLLTDAEAAALNLQPDPESTSSVAARSDLRERRLVSELP